MPSQLEFTSNMSISVTDLRSGVVFKENGEPYQVLKYSHIKMGRGNANIKIKARNLKTGAIIERNFNSGNRVEEAEIERKKWQYLYRTAESAVFMDESTYEQMEINLEVLGDALKYLTEGSPAVIISYEETPIGTELPPHVSLKVTYAEKGARGDTVTNVLKPVKVETGLVVQVPLFIKQGDIIKVDTRTGEYVERVK